MTTIQENSDFDSKIHKKATVAVKDILEKDLVLDESQNVVLIHQKTTGCKINKVLAKAYEEVLKDNPKFESIEFDENKSEELKEKLYNLKKDDLAILIQDLSFRLSDFRIRLDLKNRDILVIEHNHLEYTKTDEEIETYIGAISHDGEHHRAVAKMMAERFKDAKECTIISTDGSKLVYTGPFEETKNNVGDLREAGGSYYPIGEVFTEPVDISKVNEECLIFGFPDLRFNTILVEPFKVVFKGGKVISHEGPEKFREIIDLVKTENKSELVKLDSGKFGFEKTDDTKNHDLENQESTEEFTDEENNTEEVWVREMGFGLNRNINKEKKLSFVSAHERHAGFHISLGLKHGVFRKKIKKEVWQRFHIDMFVDVSEVYVDDYLVFKDGKYQI